MSGLDEKGLEAVNNTLNDAERWACPEWMRAKIIRAYLASATPADVGEEPVAWRYRSPWLRPKQGQADESSGFGPWHYSADEATIRVRREAGDQVQSLYPATALERGGKRCVS